MRVPPIVPWLLGGGVLAWLIYVNRANPMISDSSEAVGGAVASGLDTVIAAIAGWKNVKDGPTWVPVLNAAEQQFGIPADLLARMAYQESSFRPEYIDGSKPSSAGALGIMQLMPQYFDTVRVPRPFTTADTVAQIQQAAQELVRLMNHFNDWGLAVAAYNDGQGNVEQYVAGNRGLPAQTVDYVSAVLADVPLTGATIPA